MSDENSTRTEPAEDVQAEVVPKGYLTRCRTAEILDVKEQTLDVWASRHKGPPRVVIGRRPLYREEALYAWIRAQERDFDAERKRSRGGRQAA